MFFKFLFLVFIVLRISLFFLPGFETDVNAWKSWAERLNSLGPSDFYSSDYFSDYFPGYLYILWFMGIIYKFILPNFSFADFRFELFIKLVTLCFEIGTAFFIYKITDKFIPRFKNLAAILYLANPASIFNSSIWGQIDGIFTFFLVYSSYLLTNLKKPVLSSFWSSVSFLVKPHSLPFLPIALVYNFSHNRKLLPTIILISILTPIILSSPFFGDPTGLVDLAKRSSNVYPYTSLFAFNFWGIFGWWTPDNVIFILPYQTIGQIMYLLLLLIIVIPWIKNKIKPEFFYTAVSLSFFSFFLFMTRMHERYLFPFLPFILIAAFLNKSKLLLCIYFFMTIVHFINLWFVYYYYQFVYLNADFANNIFYKFVNDNHEVFSILSIAMFVLALVLYYKKIYVGKN